MLIIRKNAEVATLKILSNNQIKEIEVARVDGRLYKFDNISKIYKRIENPRLIDKMQRNPWLFKEENHKYINVVLVSDEALNCVHGSMVCCASSQSIVFDMPAFCDYMYSEFNLCGTVSQDSVDLFNDLMMNNNLPDRVAELVEKIKNNNLIRKNGLYAIATLCGFGTRYIPVELQNKMCQQIIDEYPEQDERHLVFFILEILNKNMFVNRLITVQNIVDHYCERG